MTTFSSFSAKCQAAQLQYSTGCFIVNDTKVWAILWKNHLWEHVSKILTLFVLSNICIFGERDIKDIDHTVTSLKVMIISQDKYFFLETENFCETHDFVA